MIPPSSRQSTLYSDAPTCRVSTSLETRRCRSAAACGPVVSIWPMCETSKTPAAVRTATCSSRMPAYWTGISQPANGTRRADAATWRSCSGVRFRVCEEASATSGARYQRPQPRPRGAVRVRSHARARERRRGAAPVAARTCGVLAVLGLLRRIDADEQVVQQLVEILRRRGLDELEMLLQVLGGHVRHRSGSPKKYENGRECMSSLASAPNASKGDFHTLACGSVPPTPTVLGMAGDAGTHTPSAAATSAGAVSG